MKEKKLAYRQWIANEVKKSSAGTIIINPRKLKKIDEDLYFTRRAGGLCIFICVKDDPNCPVVVHSHVF